MSTNDAFAIIGLTGGIASGKSTVSEMFRSLGVRVLDADAIAREVVEPGEPALAEIRERFGDDVFDDAGRLDREVLGAIVFEDENARRDLEAITHPRIAERMMQKASRAREAGEPWVLYDAALLVENGLEEAFDALVVVAVERAVQIRRLVQRDALDREEAERRIDAQMPLEKKIEVADWIVDNNGSLDRTRRQVEQLYELIDGGLEAYGTASREVLVDEGAVDPDTLGGSNLSGNNATEPTEDSEDE